MSRVICIDATGHTNLFPLTEGEIYEVMQSWEYKDAWVVKGFEVCRDGQWAHYKKIRFMPLSDTTEEAELINEHQLVTHERS